MQIFKYPVPFNDSGVPMPEGSKLLHVDAQGHDLYAWLEVETFRPIVNRKLRVFGTGHKLPEDRGKHVGTVLDRSFEWHVYDAGDDHSGAPSPPSPPTD